MKWVLVPVEAVARAIVREVDTQQDPDVVEKIMAAMAAAPAPSPDEIDELCIALAYANPAGPQWWWRKGPDGKLRDRGSQVEEKRNYDREIMQAFLKRLGEM